MVNGKIENVAYYVFIDISACLMVGELYQFIVAFCNQRIQVNSKVYEMYFVTR